MTLLDRRRALMVKAAQETVHGTWADLFRAIDAGTYATEYETGELIPIDLGTGGVLNMEIIAFDEDTISDSTDTAPVTFLSKELYKTSHRYNPEYVSGTSGTGTIGGFENSELRKYLVDTIFPMIPSAIAGRILSVKKYTRIYDTSDSLQNNVLSDEKIWIPGYREINATGGRETSGPRYAYFSGTSNFEDPKRIKAKVGGSAAIWPTRTASSTSALHIVSSAGKVSGTQDAKNSLGFAFGFCVG